MVVPRHVCGNKVGSFSIDKQLLSILVCPVTKAALEYDEKNQELVCRASGLAYPIRDGIPVMLESEARDLSADELASKPGRTPAGK